MTHITNTTSAVRPATISRVVPGQTSPTQTPHQHPQETRTVGTDQVQISDAARRLDAQNTGTPFRTELVERIRTEIESGHYDQDTKLDQAIDSLLVDLS